MSVQYFQNVNVASLQKKTAQTPYTAAEVTAQKLKATAAFVCRNNPAS